MKQIVFGRHAITQMKERCAAQEEVEETILEAPWEEAAKGRKTCHKTFPLADIHFGRYYKSKDVVPIFVEEKDRIFVITVYTFFSQKEAIQ